MFNCFYFPVYWIKVVGCWNLFTTLNYLLNLFDKHNLVFFSLLQFYCYSFIDYNKTIIKIWLIIIWLKKKDKK